jgi:DNA primase
MNYISKLQFHINQCPDTDSENDDSVMDFDPKRDLDKYHMVENIIVHEVNWQITSLEFLAESGQIQ